MIAMASAKLEMDKIWTHVKEVRKEYYRKSPAVWPDECYGFLILKGIKISESLKLLLR